MVSYDYMFRRIPRGKNAVLLLSALAAVLWLAHAYLPEAQALSTTFKYASVDTMKESRDSDYPTGNQLTPAQIADDVNLSAQLNDNYVTVNTFWDYPQYMKEWVDAVRAAGKHVWFRGHPNQWEGDNGANGLMTPAAYLTAETSFVTNNPGLFKAGDIFDPCSEPEDGPYWQDTYGANWSWKNAPNTGTNDFNNFFINATDIANAAFQQIGVSGVITTVRSTNSWWAEHPSSLYASSIAHMGAVTIDSYPDQSTTDPATAANDRVSELNTVESIRNVPVVIGEMGYDNATNVDDTVQHNVLSAEFNAMRSLTFIQGVNYWVGVGGPGYGGYTNIFTGGKGNWRMRPAANDLAAYYTQKKSLFGFLGLYV